jgi:hypothetical protein
MKMNYNPWGSPFAGDTPERPFSRTRLVVDFEYVHYYYRLAAAWRWYEEKRASNPMLTSEVPVDLATQMEAEVFYFQPSPAPLAVACYDKSIAAQAGDAAETTTTSTSSTDSVDISSLNVATTSSKAGPRAFKILRLSRTVSVIPASMLATGGEKYNTSSDITTGSGNTSLFACALVATDGDTSGAPGASAGGTANQDTGANGWALAFDAHHYPLLAALYSTSTSRALLLFDSC